MSLRIPTRCVRREHVSVKTLEHLRLFLIRAAELAIEDMVHDSPPRGQGAFQAGVDEEGELWTGLVLLVRESRVSEIEDVLDKDGPGHNITFGPWPEKKNAGKNEVFAGGNA